MKQRFMKGILGLTVIGMMTTGCSSVDESQKESAKATSATVQQLTQEAQAMKADYLEAVSLIEKQYIYLEQKFPNQQAQELFFKQLRTEADKKDWNGGKAVFIAALRDLRGQFDDGHFSWHVPNELRIGPSQSLGFVATDIQGKIIVKKVYSAYDTGLEVGDEIVTWNGKPVQSAVDELATINGHSSPGATQEVSVKRLSFDYGAMPLHKDYSDIAITVKKTNGKEENKVLKWKKCMMVVTHEETMAPEFEAEGTIFLTSGMEPSLEEIPDEAMRVHDSLQYYFYKTNGHKYAVLHLRDFSNWEMSDLEKTMEAIRREKPDHLVIDLYDSAGGSFDQVLYLSHMLGVSKPFEFTYKVRDPQTGTLQVSEENFNNISEKIHFTEVWDGPVTLRINGVAQSGCDFFARWMQINKRAMIIGEPSGGAGAGTDSIELTHTKATIDIPMRERIIKGEKESIEGHPVQPEVLWEDSLKTYLDTAK